MTVVQETYPREHIPKNAVLSAAHFRGWRRSAQKSVLDAGCAKFVTSGTQAIGLCLEHARIGRTHAVLLPAFHCTSMVTPVIWRGAAPVFYKINEDTSIDLADVESKLEKRTRVLVVPHYFGFPQHATRIREFCDRHGLIYLEDCAHAFFGTYTARPLGSFGDYAIASPWKFFPIFDGGLVISARMSLDDIPLKSPGAYFHAKAALNALEYSFEYGRLSALKTLMSLPLRAKSYLFRKLRDNRTGQSKANKTPSESKWPAFDHDSVLKEMSWPSRLAIGLAAMDDIAAARRLNYERLDDALRNVPGCRPLFPALPAEVVPQVYPLIVYNPASVFPRLRNAGVPIIRFGEFLWDGVDETVCSNSVDFSRRVFQFPCHQNLGSVEIDWMVSHIRAALGARC